MVWLLDGHISFLIAGCDRMHGLLFAQPIVLDQPTSKEEPSLDEGALVKCPTLILEFQRHEALGLARRESAGT